MATIGKLAVILSANSAALTSGLNRASKAVAGFAANAASVATGMLAADVIAGGVTGLIGLAKSTFSAADAAGDLAEKLQVSVESLTSLQHAANMTDVAQDSLTTGLNFFVKSLGKMGITTNDLLDDFAGVADEVAKLDNVVDQGALAIEYFGKQGIALLPLLRQGRGGIEALGAEARELGVAFNTVDVAKISEADNAIKRMKASVTGLGVSVASTFAPLVQAAAKFGTNIMKALRPFMQAIGDVLEPAITRMAGMFKDFSATDVLNALEPVAMSVATFADTLINTGKRMGADFFAPLLKDLATFADAFGPAMADMLKKALKPLLDVFTDIKALGQIVSFGPVGDAARLFTQVRNDLGLAAANEEANGNKPTEIGNRLRNLASTIEGVGPQSAIVDGLSGLFDAVRGRIKSNAGANLFGPFEQPPEMMGPTASWGMLASEVASATGEAMASFRSLLPDSRLGNALIGGSADAMSFINRFQAGGDSVQERMLAVEQRQEKFLGDAVKELKGLRNDLDDDADI